MHVGGRQLRGGFGARGIWIAIGVLLIAPLARADEKQICAADYEEAQLRRQRGALLASRDALRSCTRLVCPVVIQRDCARWLEEVERAIPSVIIAATADGRDAIDVTVTIDGVLSRSRLDGKPIELDPGEHELVVVLAGYPERRERVLLVEGDVRRAITVPFAKPARFVPATLPAAPTARPVPSSVYVLGAVSLASAATFATFGALALSERARLRDACSPFCTDDDARALRTRILVADLSLAVSVASLGVATVLYLTRPSRDTSPPREVAVAPVPVGAGGGLALTGRF